MEKPSPAAIAQWNRWFAIELNNLAWTLAEKPDRTAPDREQMLHAAHAAACHWREIGTELHVARADLLLGLVHALLGNGVLAMNHGRRSYDYFITHPCPDWELAFAHAVLAHAAHTAGERELHGEHYAIAQRLGASIADAADRAIFQRTFIQVAVPEMRSNVGPGPDSPPA